MELEEHSAQVSKFSTQLLELLSTDAYTVHDIMMKKPTRFNVEGVYIITTPDDNKIVYVGKTRTKSVLDRIRDHLNIDTNSDLKGMLKLFPAYPQEIYEYLIRCIDIPDARERTFFEYFLISILQPPFNK
jgi:hypothetical protein